MGLIDGSARSASVVAVENCELLAIGKQEFQRCMQENFQVAQKLMQILVRRLREADRNIESLALLDVYGRVARLLLDLSEEEDGKRLVKKKISKQDMARMIGASREMVSKVMRDLEIGGYIVKNGDQITITGA
jgi:CRP/FNR family cyclic AMP-dependent transcriptional regulator